MFLKKIISAIAAIIVITHPCIATAVTENKVNILTWWGYLTKQPNAIKEIEKICHAEISYDEYYSNDEFIDRFKQQQSQYDIVIFSDTIPTSIKQSISLPESTLHAQSEFYYPVIKAHYQKENLPHNIVYFQHSLTGFIYNKQRITLSKDESFGDILKKAKNGIVVMIDDPVEANFLISILQNQNKQPSIHSTNRIFLNWKTFKNFFGNANVIITNSPDRIVKLPEFTLAYQWTGEAIRTLQNHENLDFIIIPNLSYISTDLLAELNTTSATHCVAVHLTDKKFLNSLQYTNYYFSPYMEIEDTENIYFKKIYSQAKTNLPNLPWILPTPEDDFEKLKYSWELIKYQLNLRKSDKKT